MKVFNRKVLYLFGIILLASAVSIIAMPIRNIFVKAGDMHRPRAGHNAILLNDGRVLIVGGVHVGSSDETAEIYDPSSNNFKIIGKTTNTYNCGTLYKDKVFLLKDGRVILLSSCDNNRKAEFYDPLTNNFSLSKDEMHISRKGDFSATLLKDGRVLITGGNDQDLNQSTTASAEIYDPVLDKFRIIGNMNFPREQHSSALLPDGKVLIFGGINYNPKTGMSSHYTSVETFNPETNKFSVIGNLIASDTPLKAIELGNEEVLIVRKQPEIYNYRTNHSKLTSSMNVERNYSECIKLSNGEVLMFGGTDLSQALSTVEMYIPKLNKFSLLNDMKLPRILHTATLLNNGNVLITGGVRRFNQHGAYKETEVYKFH